MQHIGRAIASLVLSGQAMLNAQSACMVTQIPCQYVQVNAYLPYI